MMNDELAKLLDQLEKSKEKTSEHSISSKINKVTEEDQSLEAIAERLAFGFCEDYSDRQNGWGTYYGPMMVWVGDDGKAYESPSLSLVNEDVIKYWVKRSQNTSNPIMKARYSGLVWDLSETAIGKKPDYKIAIDYVNEIEWDTLYEWEKQNKIAGNARPLSIFYSKTDGVKVRDLNTGKTFRLTGVMNPHPIDIIGDECERTYGSTIGIKQCMGFELEAWDAELNRAYKALGGNKNTKLKESQLAWMKLSQ
jgi:hypothetical protein